MSDPDVIRSDIERTRLELGQDVDALADKVNPAKAAQRQTDKVRRAATRLKDRVMGSAGDVRRLDAGRGCGCPAQGRLGDAGQPRRRRPDRLRRRPARRIADPGVQGRAAGSREGEGCRGAPRRRGEGRRHGVGRPPARAGEGGRGCGHGAREGRRRDGEGRGPGRCVPSPERCEARRRPPDELTPHPSRMPRRPTDGASVMSRLVTSRHRHRRGARRRAPRSRVSRSRPATGGDRRSTPAARAPAAAPSRGRAPTSRRRRRPRAGTPSRASGGSRFHATRRSLAGSPTPIAPKSSTPASRPSRRRRFPGVRSPWIHVRVVARAAASASSHTATRSARTGASSAGSAARFVRTRSSSSCSGRGQAV